MLARGRGLWGHHIQAARASMRILGSRPLQTVMTVLVIAISLTLPTLFWVLAENAHQWMTGWQKNGRITLFLQSGMTPAAQQDFVLQLRTIPGVASTSYLSAEEGLAVLEAQEGMQDIMQYLPSNPLPAVVEITPTASIDTPEKLTDLFKTLQAKTEVSQAKFDLQWIARFYAIMGLVAKIGQGVMLLLGLAVIFVIGNTLRLAIQSRQEEIQVLKLVGATDAFIVRPFLYSGLWYGFVSALFAMLLANSFLFSVSIAAQNLAASYQIHLRLLGLSFSQMVTVVVFASALGWLGARLSVKGQLAAI